MGKVDCISWPGCVCWFWSHDHREAHFHVKSPGEWEIRVFFGEEPPRCEVVWEARPVPGKPLRKFLDEVALHRAALLAEWDAKVIVEES
jgi:hypothetical protein